MTQLRAGLAGCGERGAWSLEQAASSSDCRFVALFDPDLAAAERLAAAHGIGKSCDSFEALLQTGIDLVVLASPPGVHRQQVEVAAAQGVHCLVHAPVAVDAVDAAAMVAACDRASVKLGVLVPEQGDPMLDELRRMIADDFLGAPVLAHAVLGDDRAMRTPWPEGHWRRQPALSGSHLFVQLAAEALHFTAWVLGRDAVAVTAQATTGFTVEAQDSAVATAELRGGALLTMAATHLARGRAFMVHGTDGAALVASDRVLLRGRHQWPGPLLGYAGSGELCAIPRQDSPARQRLLGEVELHGRFARWIDDLDGYPCPGEQALLDQKAIDALARSVRSGQRERV